LPKGLKVDDAVILGKKQDEVPRQKNGVNETPSGARKNTSNSTEGTT
jgi:hypothetical protein